MPDETLNVLRKVMIDRALESGNRDAFRNLTGPNWQDYVVDGGSEREGARDRLAFLSDDPHFWDLRLYDTMGRRPYLNYRFRDTIDGVLCIGEIRIPIGWKGNIQVKFHPRPSRGGSVPSPGWFQSLLSTTVALLELELAQ